jgi:cbb3-type cytochrome oxidase maturation protein
MLISISLAIALAFLAMFLWSIRSGQFDDTYTPSVRMLFEDRYRTIQKDKTIKKTDKNQKAV